MRIYEIDSNHEYSDSSSIIENLINKLETECSDILQVYRTANAVFYRGEKTTKYFFMKQIRQDRKPVEFNEEAHILLHKIMLQHGIKATRMNSIFCTGRQSIADSWGDIFVIFPKDGWSASWFSKTKQHYSFYDLDRIVRKSYIDQYAFIPKLDEQEFIKNVESYFKFNPPIGTSSINTLSDYLKINPIEILITGSDYYAMSYKFLIQSVIGKQIVNKLGLTLQD